MSDIPAGREFWLDLRHQIARGIWHPSDAGVVLHSILGTFHRHRPQDMLVSGDIAAQRLDRVQADIDRLPYQTREIFIMHRWQDMKYRDIADRLGISVAAVEAHMADAMLSLANWNDSL